MVQKPIASDGPHAALEIVVDMTQDTLTLFRDHKKVAGYPILAVASGIPVMAKRNPIKTTKVLVGGNGFPHRNVFVLTERGHIMKASEAATNYKSWREERQEAYKNRRTGFLTVEPKKMETLFECTQKFANENVYITTHR